MIWQSTFEVHYDLTNAHWHFINGAWFCGQKPAGDFDGDWTIRCTNGSSERWDPRRGGALNNPCILPVAALPAVAAPLCGGVARSPGCPPLNLVNASLSPNAGRIGFSPVNPEMHLVNLQSCFWIDGTANGEQEIGILDPRGTSVFFFYVRIGIARVDWDFGDGSPIVSGAGPFGLGTPAPEAACENAGGPSVHTYTKISQGTVPGDHYQVTAAEHFGMTVTGQRCDETNGGGIRCSSGRAVDISRICPTGFAPDADIRGCDVTTQIRQPIFVGQVEGIPVPIY
jgi:hypothetical protein